MNRTWLVLDVSSLAYRAYYTMGKLSFDGDLTGVLFGFFRDMVYLGNRFSTTKFAFTFDSSKSLREKDFPAYKANRRSKSKLDPSFRDDVACLRRQVEQLRVEYLPEIGYGNLFLADGYEADDLMAAIRGGGDYLIYVTQDKDCYQLICEEAAVYCPRSQALWDLDSFQRHYGILPKDWPLVKALQGDEGDNIPGIRGVGPSSALLYYRNRSKLLPHYLKKITQSFDTPYYKLMLKLVKLPYPGCPPCRLIADDLLSQNRWTKVMTKLGIRTLPTLPGYGTNAEVQSLMFGGAMK